MSESQIKKEIEDRVFFPTIEWPKRMMATLFVLFFTFLFGGLIVVLKNDLVNEKIEETKDWFLDYIGKEGLALEDIVLIGRERTELKEINELLELKRGDNLLKIDVKLIKQQLETLPWVRDVNVVRSFFPNILKIELKEKEVLAIWQLNERFYPLDMDGYVIEADYRPNKPILLIVGVGAAENILSFLKMVKDIDASYLSRIKVANFISKRRWNVILDDIRSGITVKLPEEKIEEAWRKLLKLDETKGILKRKLTIIDLRLEGKVTVKLRKSKSVKAKQEQEI